MEKSFISTNIQDVHEAVNNDYEDNDNDYNNYHFDHNNHNNRNKTTKKRRRIFVRQNLFSDSSAYLGSSSHSEGAQVSKIVLNILDGVGDNGNAHVDQICRGNVKNGCRKLLPVLVNLLHRHLA